MSNTGGSGAPDRGEEKDDNYESMYAEWVRSDLNAFPSPEEADTVAANTMEIEELDLTVHSYNCLKRDGIHTLNELLDRSETDLLGHANFDAKSIEEIKMKLHGLGLSLKECSD